MSKKLMWIGLQTGPQKSFIHNIICVHSAFIYVMHRDVRMPRWSGAFALSLFFCINFLSRFRLLHRQHFAHHFNHAVRVE